MAYMPKECPMPKKSCRTCSNFLTCKTGFHELAVMGLSEIAKRSTNAKKLHEIVMSSIAKYCKDYSINEKER